MYRNQKAAKISLLIAFRTSQGSYSIQDSTSGVLGQEGVNNGSVDLLLTSPPFPLNKKKRYGNFQGQYYLDWFRSLAPLWSEWLAEEGSIVIEMGNAWEPGRPVQSLLPLQSLLAFLEHPDCSFRLIQEFICYNPSRLPSPAAWVTRERIRAIDSYTHVWWIAKSDYPKADNRKVLRPYSKSMKDLLKRQSFNRNGRPSGHHISEKGFLTDHGGSIAHNLVEMEAMETSRNHRLPFIAEENLERLPVNAFSLANTRSNDYFSRTLRSYGIRRHPAPMQPGLAAFFIQFLTEPGDQVLDPFAGSNTTGYCAEKLDRCWIALEEKPEYALQALLRMQNPELESEITYVSPEIQEQLQAYGQDSGQN